MTRAFAEKDWAPLVGAAEAARKRAYAPYSKFAVGAALRVAGAIYAGANVENSSYGLSLCAERGAVAAAVAAGAPLGRMEALVIATAALDPTPPCGACRQVLREFAADLPIRLVARGGRTEDLRLADLLAHAFVPAHLSGRSGR